MAEISLNGKVDGSTDVPLEGEFREVPQPPKGGPREVRFDENDPNTRVFTADGISRLFVLGQVGDVQVSVDGLTSDDFVVTENEMKTKILAFNDAPPGGKEIRVSSVALPPEEVPQGGEPNQNPVPENVMNPPVGERGPEDLPPGQVSDAAAH